jgi:hypothetical protein
LKPDGHGTHHRCELDDAAWAAVPVINTFTQRDPVEGAATSDDGGADCIDNLAIYIAGRFHDRSPRRRGSAGVTWRPRR